VHINIMEEVKSPTKVNPVGILSKKTALKHASTYSHSVGIERAKRKRVSFVDRTNLCTIFNYEQVEVEDEPSSPKSTSCACIIF
jgi:hypothetical protein